MPRYWAALGLLCLTASPLTAQSYSQADEAACRPDVFRLCAGEIPNKARIIACLERRRTQLSPACSQVWERNRTPPNGPAATTRGIGQPQPIPPEGYTRWGR